MKNMEWNKLLSARRFGKSSGESLQVDEKRSEFQRDYDRIIFSSPFRRLQNKTQVFPLPGSVFVHNRLTHSIEVASVGRSLGNRVFGLIESQLKSSEEKSLVREIDTVTSTACLAHDLGNPPFGHSGEKAISSFFVDGKGKGIKELVTNTEFNDLVHFEGNANLIRLLTNQFTGRRYGGYSLTLASLGAMIKYPFSSEWAEKRKKFGYFQSEKDTFHFIINELGISEINDDEYARHPLVFLMEAADDICYQIMDIEDAHKLGILSFQEVQETFLRFFNNLENNNMLEKIDKTFMEVTDRNEQVAFLRAMTINKLVIETASVFEQNYDLIMKGAFHSKLIKEVPDYVRAAYKQASQIARSRIYNHPSVVKIEISGYKVLGFLLDEFYSAVFKPELDYSEKILSLIPRQYRIESENPYLLARSVVDFISGMTDVYAVELYKQIRGEGL